jgi:hypothetical protein
MFYIGVDGEMSHNEVNDGGALLQLGVAVRDKDGVMQHFNTLMRPTEPYTWDEAAANVHGFTREQVDSWTVTTADADKLLFDWLANNGCRHSKRSDNVAVGFSVGSFDMLFIKKFLPQTATVFSRRFYDLNSLVYMLSVKTGEKFLTVKKNIMDETVERIGYDKAHDAGWDAIMHVVFMETVLEKISLTTG